MLWRGGFGLRELEEGREREDIVLCGNDIAEENFLDFFGFDAGDS